MNKYYRFSFFLSLMLWPFYIGMVLVGKSSTSVQDTDYMYFFLVGILFFVIMNFICFVWGLYLTRKNWTSSSRMYYILSLILTSIPIAGACATLVALWLLPDTSF